MDKIEAMNLLMLLERRQGELNGRWENEYIIEDSSYRYFYDITEIADKCKIEYGNEDKIEKEIEEIEKDTNCVNARERWTYILFKNIEEFLCDIILRNDINENLKGDINE